MSYKKLAGYQFALKLRHDGIINISGNSFE